MQRMIKAGSTDKSLVIRIVDSTDGTPETGVTSATGGLALWYRREGGLKVAITPASLAALNDAHADGGILHISDGYYRLDVPDAAFAASADGVMIGGSVTSMVVIGTYIQLSAIAILSELPSAADVWTSATRTLTSYGTLVTDIWNAATRTLTSGGGASAAEVWTYGTRTLTSFGTLVAEIVAALTAVAAQVVEALNPTNNDRERYRGDTWSLAWTAIGSLAGYVSLDFTIKDTSRLYDNDAGALLKIRKNASGLNDGLLYMNGSTDGVTAGWGSITIDDATSGNITAAVSNSATYQLPPGTYSYDLQRITASGSTTLVVGNFTILADVTRAIA